MHFQVAWVYIFKPLTMVIIIATAGLSGANDSSFYHWLLLGLCLSLLGDIFLMLPSDKLVHGLGSFLLAHIAYIIGFIELYDGTLTAWWLGAITAFSLGYYIILSSKLGSLKGPVIVYISAISVMVWLSGELYFLHGSTANLLLLIGALVFALSDASLAWNRFKKPFRGAQWLILTTYFGAQYLFIQAMLAI